MSLAPRFCLSLIPLIVGAAGLYMWFKLHRERMIGAVLFSANLIISIILLAFLRS